MPFPDFLAVESGSPCLDYLLLLDEDFLEAVRFVVDLLLDAEAFLAAARFLMVVRLTLLAAAAAPFLPAADSFSCVLPLVLAGPVRFFAGVFFFAFDSGLARLISELDFFL